MNVVTLGGGVVLGVARVVVEPPVPDPALFLAVLAQPVHFAESFGVAGPLGSGVNHIFSVSV